MVKMITAKELTELVEKAHQCFDQRCDDELVLVSSGAGNSTEMYLIKKGKPKDEIGRVMVNGTNIGLYDPQTIPEILGNRFIVGSIYRNLKKLIENADL